MPRSFWLFLLLISSVAPAARADETFAPIARVLPPPGIQIPVEKRREIEHRLAEVDRRLDTIRQGALVEWDRDMADIAVYAKAVRFALLNDEFYSDKGPAIALDLLARADHRLDEYERGNRSWEQAHGQFVVGYRSAIDGSVQPYGLEIPPDLDLSKPVPLYVWLHGRGDKETDLYFIKSRDGGKPGELQPKNAIVLNLFGRMCLGFKSAGEADLLEALRDVDQRYKIDHDRVALAGFSMGGAGAWHLGAHFADQFCAVHAGAGFVDVARYQHLTPDKFPPVYEQTLWGQYDVPDYTRNLFNTTMIAYGGEIDPQRASSQIMAECFKAEGQTLNRIVGPKMGHRYDPASLKEIRGLLAAAVSKGRNRFPRHLSLQTRTLRYNHMFWASIQELGQQWQDARLDADVADDRRVLITTRNVTRFCLNSPWPADKKQGGPIEVKIDGEALTLAADELTPAADDLGLAHPPPPAVQFHRTAGGWQTERTASAAAQIRKSPGLQGPIDDAFVEPFALVEPAGHSPHPAVEKWVNFEKAHFIERWRATFRGDVPILKESDVTADIMAGYNLILWGDPASNAIIAKTVAQTPLNWSKEQIQIAGQTFAAAGHVPVMIYPNPLNRSHYIVINSGPTFREASDHTNSLQNPKLPDWAVIDLSTPPDAAAPGKVAAADFFDEAWRAKPSK